MAGFTLYPAIDLRQGKVVRLAQGDLARQTLYDREPENAARRWLLAGASWLHVVNLDGAFEQADHANRQALQVILQAASEFNPACSVQFGGGLRTLDAIEQILSAGVQRAVLGTAAIQNPKLVEQALQRFGADRVAASLDARQGQVMLRGWTEPAALSATTAAQRLASAGIRTVIFTDIARDGIGSGINLAATTALAQKSGLNVIASGGVHDLANIRQARQAGLAGVIVGRALYDGVFTLEEALRSAEDAG